ncbi:unnamed protein product [Rotaria sp. Silwood2]|nr:unnamed protein product [Rotaria sp. Silwood2]CAF3476110.1 unnamed protein product [Rotaria sp. Silwood2]CAF4083014.1 unnamed protein product [Rotaria sp. Silwood2]CAF4465444.1 unnamed protein product [Rotaria sp. Silwood2]CAF4593411.1 unnamed protein product [Rotaria sp. Silwood2]
MIYLGIFETVLIVILLIVSCWMLKLKFIDKKPTQLTVTLINKSSENAQQPTAIDKNYDIIIHKTQDNERL